MQMAIIILDFNSEVSYVNSQMEQVLQQNDYKTIQGIIRSVSVF